MTDPEPIEDRLLRNPPARMEDIVEIEVALDTLMPDELVQLYRSSDGQYSVRGHWWVVWPLSQMADAKSWLRLVDGYLDDWVPFGDDGTGDPYCFHRDDQSITRLSMIDLRHERIAADLSAFVKVVLSSA